jgi:hypothetical protein
MQVIVHVGLPKTGSSSIQRYLAQHREEMRQGGVHYPDFDGEESHSALAVAVRENPELYWRSKRRRHNGLSVPEWIENTMGKLRDCLAGATPSDLLILSSEGLISSESAVELQRLLGILNEYAAEVRVLAYIRNPVEHYPSAFQQALKMPTGQMDTPSKWMSGHSKRVAALLKALRKDQINLRVFSRSCLIKSDVIEDFRAYAGKVSEKTLPAQGQEIVANSSLSGEACALLMAVRTRMPAPDDLEYRRLRARIMAFDRDLKRPKLRLPDKWASAITTINGRDWNDLIDMTDLDDDRKQELRLNAAEDLPPWIRQQEVVEWCLSHGSEAYAAEFKAFCMDDKKFKRIKPRMASGITDRLNRATDVPARKSVST